MPATVPQTESILLSYFETGDIPTQEQFEELIRTLFYLQAQTAALVQGVEDLVNTYALPVAAGKTTWNGVLGNPDTVLKQVGCAIVVTADRSGSDFSLQLDVTFTVARADANYIVLTETSNAAHRTLSNVTTAGFRLTWGPGLSATIPTSTYFSVIDAP